MEGAEGRCDLLSDGSKVFSASQGIALWWGPQSRSELFIACMLLIYCGSTLLSVTISPLSIIKLTSLLMTYYILNNKILINSSVVKTIRAIYLGIASSASLIFYITYLNHKITHKLMKKFKYVESYMPK